jgi:hypothetical protein
MHRVIMIIFLACFILAACNLPIQKATETPNAEAIATQVRALLTAQPSPTSRPATPTLSTPAATSTIAPTSTQSATSTAAASITPLPGDPKNSLGEPSYKNTFDTGKGFGLEAPFEDENIRFAVENGKLVMTGLKANGWHSWRLTSPKVQDFYLEGTTHTTNCSGTDIYGLVVRAPDFDSGRGYYFGVTCDGRFNFGKWQEQGINDIVSLTQNSAILAGPDQTNRLGIMARGDHISLYANGKLIQELDDTAFETAGYFGVWLAANKTAGFNVEVDELDFWKLQ